MKCANHNCSKEAKIKFCSVRCSALSRKWTPEMKKHFSEIHKGIKLTKEHKNAISESIKTSEIFNSKNWSSIHALSHKKKPRKGWKQPIDSNLKRSITCKASGVGKWMLGRKLSPEHVKNALKRREMSSLEKKLSETINNFNLPYKWVGNGVRLIGGKVPDFINEERKIVVEVFCRKHKDFFRNGWENWQKHRSEIFIKEGWKPIFINETQISNTQFIHKILKEALDQ